MLPYQLLMQFSTPSAKFNETSCPKQSCSSSCVFDFWLQYTVEKNWMLQQSLPHSIKMYYNFPSCLCLDILLLEKGSFLILM